MTICPSKKITVMHSHYYIEDIVAYNIVHSCDLLACKFNIKTILPTGKIS